MQITIPLRRIEVRSNPRKFFNPATMAELTASVREQGVIQPILVRPGEEDGQYILIAGERRVRAATEARGLDYEVPALVHDVDEATAKALALTENVQRDDMSAAEEAIAAAEQVGLLKGDRDEAARILGWSRATLDKRLALMNCTTAVLEALTYRTITLGHAELFAGFKKSDQDSLLPVIVQEKRSVAELKALLEKVSCSLAVAIFDKADCAACPHNSALQVEMFGESIGTGNCTDRNCYHEKTEKQLEIAAAGLRDEFPVVKIVRAGDNATCVQLAVDGKSGVGLEQAKQCHACQNYGAAVSGLPDSLGKVYRGQCFDTVCNMKKVAARIKAEKNAAAPTSSGKSATSKASDTASAGKPAPEASAVAESDKVKAYREALWRRALCRDIGRDADRARVYLLTLAMNGHGRAISTERLAKAFTTLGKVEAVPKGIADTVTSVGAMSVEVQSQMLIATLFAAIDGLDVATLKELCKANGLDLTQYWKLDKAFLELITKSEMKVVADELGIRAALGDAFSKTFNKPKGELIDALLAIDGFDYTGKVIKVLKY